MTSAFLGLPWLLQYWENQKRQYSPAVYILLLCGTASDLDQDVFDYVSAHHLALNDMSGPYSSFTILARSATSQSSPPPPDRHAKQLPYLHVAEAWQLGAPGVYQLCHQMNVSLSDLPAILMTADPWSSQSSVWPLSRIVDHGRENFASIWPLLFTACREVSELPLKDRLHGIEKRVRKSFSSNALSGIRDSGIVAQIVEGITKGLMPPV
jgi:hypothetical protein